MLNYIHSGLNLKKKVILTLDIKKAFDTISHPIMLYKLFRCGIDYKTLQWFTSYLADRKQFIYCNGKSSTTRTIPMGIGQGSLLGSLLFVIYINEITNIGLEGDVFLYADDTNLIFTGNSFNDLATIINRNLLKLNDWLSENRLTLNVEKTNYLIINLSVDRHLILTWKSMVNLLNVLLKRKFWVFY